MRVALPDDRPPPPTRRRLRRCVVSQLPAMRRLAIVPGCVVLASARLGGGPGLAEETPITAEFAQNLYARVGPLRESDGCRLTRFDTSRYRITIGLETSAGAPHTFDLGALPAP